MQKYNRYTDAFPDKVNVNEVVVEADDVRSGEVAAAIDELVAQAGESETFIAPADITYSEDGTVAQIALPSRGNGTDQKSIDALDEVRDDLVPATVGAVDGADANVTGGAASTEDFNQVLDERMPLVFAFVLGLAFVLLLITFRSIVIPIKAIVLNLLSVGAAYGVLVDRVPERRGRVAAGLRVQRRSHQLAARVPVRDPVRALDGLPRVHPHAGPRALRPGHEHRRRRPRGHLAHGRHGHERGGRHGRACSACSPPSPSSTSRRWESGSRSRS